MARQGIDGRPAQPAIRSVEAGDVALLYRAWEAENPRAHLRIIHGLGEHGGRYTRLAEALLSRGISTFAADLRGHGVSGGRRGHVHRFEDYLDDFQRICAAAPERSPAFLLGHSLGGLIALRLLQTDRAGRLHGAILSAPAVDLPDPQPWWRDPAARAVAPLFPTLTVSNGIDPSDLSRDPMEVEAYRSDPLVHDRVTIRLFREMRSAMREARRNGAAVAVPVLLLAPGDDRVTEVSAARRLAMEFAVPAEIRDLPDHLHEPLHDREAGVVTRQIVQWIEARIR